MSSHRIREFYEARAATYGPTDKEGRRRYSAALSLAHFQSSNLILDIGCKVALLPDILSERSIPYSYVGTDLSSIVQKVHARQNVQLVQADVTDGLPFENGMFTHVFCLELLEHVVSPLKLLQEIRRVLKPDGELLLSVPNPYYWAELYWNLRGVPDTEGHISSFTPQTMSRLLDFAGFKVRSRRGTYFEVPMVHWVVRSPLVSMPNWLLARSVVHAAVSHPDGE